MKKITSILIVLALVLTMSVGVVAADTYANEAAANAATIAAGTEITVAGVDYIAIDDASQIEDLSKSYYLLKDITWPSANKGVFTGSLNGGNHTITLTGDSLFEKVSGTDSVISNLKIDGEKIVAASYFGTVAVIANGGTFKNITNYVDFEASAGSSGGIIGYTEDGATTGTITFEKCINYGDLTVGSVSGGIVGSVYKHSKVEAVTFKNCVNNGKIQSSGNDVGGIVGDAEQSIALKNLTFEGCVNNGTVTGGKCVGGIFGALKDTTSVEIVLLKNCVNNAEIKGTEHVGGVIGSIYIRDGKVYDCEIGSVTLQNCTNNGRIAVTGNYYCGGVLGSIKNVKASFTVNFLGCVNNAEVYAGKSCCGGILGAIDQTTQNVLTININRSINNGKVYTDTGTDNSGIGGIVGALYNACYELNVSESGNNAEINNHNSHAAAILGGHTGSASIAKISITNCFNTGAIRCADGTAGALVSWENAQTIDASSKLDIKNSYSSVKGIPLIYIVASENTYPVNTVTDSAVVADVAAVVSALNNAANASNFCAEDSKVMIEYDYVTEYHDDETDKNYVSTGKDVASDRYSGAEFAGFVQFANNGSNKVRFVMAIDEYYLTQASAEYESFDIVVTYNGVSKTVNSKGLSAFVEVTAGDKVYNADECQIFGFLMDFGNTTLQTLSFKIVVGETNFDLGSYTAN